MNKHASVEVPGELDRCKMKHLSEMNVALFIKMSDVRIYILTVTFMTGDSIDTKIQQFDCESSRKVDPIRQTRRCFQISAFGYILVQNEIWNTQSS
jgi:hypothetical protein